MVVTDATDAAATIGDVVTSRESLSIIRRARSRPHVAAAAQEGGHRIRRCGPMAISSSNNNGSRQPAVVVHAAWFTPARLLFLFCLMSMLIYVDRGVISSAAVSGAPGTSDVAGSGLQGDFDIGYYQYGGVVAG